MNNNLLKPRATGSRLRQAQDARNMQQLVEERCRKKGADIPDYEFLELIGKGNYGRVYKSKRRKDQQVCAVKIIEVDKQDYKAEVNLREDTINEFIRETAILRSLKDNNAKNVNQIFDAFAVDTQLWIVSEYCPGGSLSTLIKASPKRSNGVGCLEEPFIIPIAREVAIALKYVHEAGFIHRDIKCANILVTEDGRIQLCDFGVSGVLETGASKRTTIIGTPHWMAPELVPHLGSSSDSIQYGTEVDCWAFGCAVYEMATGFPPNYRVRVDQLRFRGVIPRLEGDDHSDELKAFVAFCLQEQPENRPTAARIIEHPYVKDTEENYPTKRIQNLIERFAVWEESGNQRESLFNPYGAQGPTDDDDDSDVDTQEWNFSTSIEFEKRMSMGIDPFGRNKNNGPADSLLARQAEFMEQQRVMRGEDAMKGIFDVAAKPYTFGEQPGDLSDNSISDLPFRNLDSGPVRDRTTMIDLDFAEFDEAPTLDLDSVPTIRARRHNHLYDDDDDIEFDRSSKAFNDNLNPNRATMEWTFPGAAAAESEQPRKNASVRKTMEWSFNNAQAEVTARKSTVPADVQETDFAIAAPSPGRPALIHSKTMPVDGRYGHEELLRFTSSPPRHSLIDLDSALTLDIPDIERPPTASSMADSAITDLTSGDPFDLDNDYPTIQDNRGSMHMKSQSEPTAAFQTSKQTRANHNVNSSEGQGSHNRSSSTTRSDIGHSPAKRSWQNQGSDPMNDSGTLQNAWDSFSGSEQTTLRSEDRYGAGSGVNSKMGHRRRMRSSLSSTYTTGTSSQGSIGDAQTLRPQATRMMNASGMMPNVRLKHPRPPNMGVLLPNADRLKMEEELSLVYEELAYQSDTMIQLLNSLALEEEAIVAAGVGEAPTTLSDSFGSMPGEAH